MLLRRLPLHAEGKSVPAIQLARLRKKRLVLVVATEGEAGYNLYPGPAYRKMTKLELKAYDQPSPQPA
jgi:hypothetical protein